MNPIVIQMRGGSIEDVLNIPPGVVVQVEESGPSIERRIEEALESEWSGELVLIERWESGGSHE